MHRKKARKNTIKYHSVFTTIIILVSIFTGPAAGECHGEALTNCKKWVKVFGGRYAEIGYSIRQTKDGGYIVAVGKCENANTGNADIWLIKLDRNGKKEWERIFGIRGKDDFPFCVQQTKEGGYILVGYTASYGNGKLDAWLIKTDENGNEEWNRTFGGKKVDRGTSVEQTNDGGYIIAGDTESFGSSKLISGWLIKTDENGNEEWNRTFGDKEIGIIFVDIHRNRDGNYVVLGNAYNKEEDKTYVSLIKTDRNGDIIWEREYGFNSAYCINQTSDGGYIIAGENGMSDWITKIDKDGNIEWNKTLHPDDKVLYSTARSIRQTHDGGYIAVGWRGDAVPLFVIILCPTYYFPKMWTIKLDEKGNIEWERTFFSLGYWMWGLDVQPTADKGYVILGVIERFQCWNENDIVIVKTDENGRTDFLRLMVCGILHDFVEFFFSK